MSSKPSVTNQTLDRGLRVLSTIAQATTPPSIEDLASELGVHRSMAYRLVRTLEDHGLTRRDDAGRCHPGLRLAELARSVDTSVRNVARPELERLADLIGHTAFLVVRSGGDAVTIDSAEPTQSDLVVSYRPGTRHRLDRGAPGMAILAGQPAIAGERKSITTARERGWADSNGEVVPGLGSLATWIEGPDGKSVAAIACLHLAQEPVDTDRVVAQIRDSSRHISAGLGNPVESADLVPFNRTRPRLS